MPRQHLTQAFLNRLEPPPPTPEGKPRQVFYFDPALSGFGVRVTSGGSAAFILERRPDGKSSARRITLGKVNAMTLAQAKRKATALLGEIATGADPVERRRRHALEALTLGEAFDRYVATKRRLKASTVANYQKDLRWGMRDWLDRPLTSIDGEAALKRHAECSRRSPARANGAFRVLRAVFNHARTRYRDDSGRSIFPNNPVDALTELGAWNEIRPREDYLRPTQLPKWYDATLQLNQFTARDYLHLVLLTGLRKTEAAALAWEHIDLDERTLTIPAGTTKNSDPHVLPLSTQLYALLRARHEARETPWVFPNRTGTNHLREPRTAVDRVGTLAGIPFRLHDLRRTFITTAERLDLPHYALQRLMNHRRSDITATYIQIDVERLREPMQRVSDALWQAMTGESAKIVRFPGAQS